MAVGGLGVVEPQARGLVGPGANGRREVGERDDLDDPRERGEREAEVGEAAAVEVAGRDGQAQVRVEALGGSAQARARRGSSRRAPSVRSA